MKPSKTQVGGDHYKDMAIQPHYFCHVNKLGALEANVIKYVCRHAAKNGKADLLKAKHYVELLLEWQYGDDGETAPLLNPSGRPYVSIAEANLAEASRMASAGTPLITPPPPRLAEVQCVCGWTGKGIALQRATARPHPFCPDCGADFLPPELRTGWPYEPHPEQATCIAHGLTVCKVCMFPTGTKG